MFFFQNSFPEKLVIPLEDDFIKIDIVEKHNNNNTKVTSEYHMYPLKKPPNEGDPPFEKYSHKKNKYNVLMIMTDSVSHACAQRYIPKTYKYLSENPNTVIMKVRQHFSIFQISKGDNTFISS